MDPSFTHLGSLENFLGKEPNQELIDEYSNELHITNETPRVFITLQKMECYIIKNVIFMMYLLLCIFILQVDMDGDIVQFLIII